EGVASIGKHFPGHGETPPGEDDDLPRMPHRFSRLEEVELRPFRAAMDARVAGIMVGHLVFEALDGRLPASLSRAIVFGLLRQKMSYRGVVMIDDVDSGGLERHHSRDVVALRGIASGADCFLCARRPESAWELISALENGLRNGSVVPERLEVARRRIDQVLHRYAQRPN